MNIAAAKSGLDFQVTLLFNQHQINFFTLT